MDIEKQFELIDIYVFHRHIRPKYKKSNIAHSKDAQELNSRLTSEQIPIQILHILTHMRCGARTCSSYTHTTTVARYVCMYVNVTGDCHTRGCLDAFVSMWLVYVRVLYEANRQLHILVTSTASIHTNPKQQNGQKK